jgi:hypothetical protein
MHRIFVFHCAIFLFWTLEESMYKKLKSCPTARHEGTLGGGGRKYSSCLFLTSALDGGEWSASRPANASPPGKGPPVTTVQEAGWAPEPVWTQRLEEKSFCLYRDRTPIVRSFSPYSDTILNELLRVPESMYNEEKPSSWSVGKHRARFYSSYHISCFSKETGGRISVVDAVPIETSDAILPLRPGRLCDTSVSYPLGGGVLFPRDKVDGLWD